MLLVQYTLQKHKRNGSGAKREEHENNHVVRECLKGLNAARVRVDAISSGGEGRE